MASCAMLVRDEVSCFDLDSYSGSTIGCYRLLQPQRVQEGRRSLLLVACFLWIVFVSEYLSLTRLSIVAFGTISFLAFSRLHALGTFHLASSTTQWLRSRHTSSTRRDGSSSCASSSSSSRLVFWACLPMVSTGST